MGDNHRTYSSARRMRIIREDYKQKDKIIRMYKSGVDLDIIAKAFKVTSSSIRNLLKEWGVDVRSVKKENKTKPDGFNSIRSSANCICTNDCSMLDDTSHSRYSDIDAVIKHLTRNGI